MRDQRCTFTTGRNVSEAESGLAVRRGGDIPPCYTLDREVVLDARTMRRALLPLHAGRAPE